MNSNYEYFSKIKHELLAPYPTTVRRSVCLANTIFVDHSINSWLYEHWLTKHTIEQELDNLQQEIAKKISDNIDNPGIQVKLVHLDPLATQHTGVRD